MEWKVTTVRIRETMLGRIDAVKDKWNEASGLGEGEELWSRNQIMMILIEKGLQEVERTLILGGEAEEAAEG